MNESDLLTPNGGVAFTYSHSQREGAEVFICRGPMVLNCHPTLDELIGEARAARQTRVVLDLAAVTRVDSVGVGTLAKILRTALGTGHDLVLVLNAGVCQALDQASLSNVFRSAGSLEAALKLPSK